MRSLGEIHICSIPIPIPVVTTEAIDVIRNDVANDADRDTDRNVSGYLRQEQVDPVTRGSPDSSLIAMSRREAGIEIETESS